MGNKPEYWLRLITVDETGYIITHTEQKCNQNSELLRGNG